MAHQVSEDGILKILLAQRLRAVPVAGLRGTGPCRTRLTS
jgi:hypothetical protein